MGGVGVPARAFCEPISTGDRGDYPRLHITCHRVLLVLRRNDRIRTCDPLVPNQVRYPYATFRCLACPALGSNQWPSP